MRALLLSLLAVVSLAFAALKATGRLPATPPTPREIAREVLAAYPGASGIPATPDPNAAGVATLFTDVAPAVGLSFVHDNAAHGRFYLPEEMGPGAGLLDYDGDGDLDLFVAGGGRLVEGEEGAIQTCRLYRNDGERFTDVTTDAHADLPGHAFGVACADYDDDGDVDIFVTRLGPNAMLRNEGNGTFREVAPEVGLADESFGTSAAFFDYDADGDLDLYVANYVRWAPERAASCYTILGIRDYCNPVMYPPTTDRLYRNAGDGTFENVTESAGIAAETGNGLGVIASDFDGDGWPDLYVANDQTPAFLWHNEGDGTFSSAAAMSGCAYDSRGVAIAGMGVACEDVDGDGDGDLLVTNIHQQSHLLLRNDGGFFEDIGVRAGLGAWSIPATGFGVAMFDQDHDGGFDAFFANGAVNVDNLLRVSDNPYAQPDHFARIVDGLFVDATLESGAAFGDVGRGVAAGDVDGDGDVDLVVTNNGGPLRLLRNENASGHWLIVHARLGPGRRHAIGATVRVHAGDRTFTRVIRAQQSYLCSGDPRGHFGLGDRSAIERVEITWPGGRVSTHDVTGVDRVLVIDRPADPAS